jgi:putative sigma-54 modulation protein
MQIQIKGTKVDLTPELKAYIEEKMNMLEKYLGSVKPVGCSFEVSLAVGGQNSGKIYTAEANLDLPGERLRIEKTEKDIFKAIDKVKDHLKEAIVKYRGKKLGI